jgi:hypothetical protein
VNGAGKTKRSGARNAAKSGKGNGGNGGNAPDGGTTDEAPGEKKERRQRRMLQQQERPQETTATAYSDAYCLWCGFGPDEELPAYVDCPDHLQVLTRGHPREVRRHDWPHRDHGNFSDNSSQ